MSTLAEIEEATEQLDHAEKLHLMEILWDGLSRGDADLASPAWHGDVLAETERRWAEGREKVLDWGDVKAGLRSKLG